VKHLAKHLWLLVLFAAPGWLAAQETPVTPEQPSNPADSNSFYVPDTVSTEAAATIKHFKKSWRNRDWPAPDDVAAWAARKKEYEDSTLPTIQKLIDTFSPTISEKRINGVKVLDIKPKDWDASKGSKRVVVYFHGGAYTLFSARSSLNYVLPLADMSKLRVIAVNYTTAPQARWQQTVEDAANVIQGIYQTCSDHKVAVMGDSAGGGLATAALLKLKDDKQPLPAALLLWSPWTDVTQTGDTYHTLQDHELHYIYPQLLQHSANAYADPADQKHPYVSPVYGTFTADFPPTLIQGGTKEILLSGFVRLYQNIDTVNGHHAKLDLYEGMWHVFQGNHELPETQAALRKSAAFLQHYLK